MARGIMYLARSTSTHANKHAAHALEAGALQALSLASRLICQLKQARKEELGFSCLTFRTSQGWMHCQCSTCLHRNLITRSPANIPSRHTAHCTTVSDISTLPHADIVKMLASLHLVVGDVGFQDEGSRFKSGQGKWLEVYSLCTE